MNFITFSSDATNLFPASNSLLGGQLVTEWNLRSREMVATDSRIDYQVGPSFVHSETDFEVTLLKDAGGAVISNYTLSVAEGRGVINGHYVETLAPMTIDLLEANAKLASQARPLLKGDLAIGIRTFYATEETIAGSILVEDENHMFLGIQLVILPVDEMITPEMSPTDKSLVTADLILAKFVFLNNRVTEITNSKDKMQYIPANRLANFEGIVSDSYVTKTGLNSKKIYAFAGKGKDPSTGFDTWEDVTDSLIVWDNEPVRTLTKPTYKEAQFVPVSNDVYLVLPHKQVTGMTDDYGNYEYYAPRIVTFPRADYATGKPGIVNSTYTNQIKNLAVKVNDFRTSLHGKQVYFMDVRTVTTNLPAINPDWDYGDYVFVKNDDYFMGESSATESSPATMYFVLPGEVRDIRFITQVNGSAGDEPAIPSNILGAELSYQEWFESSGQSRPNTEYPEYYPQFYDPSEIMRGIPYDSSSNKWFDYFKIRYYEADTTGNYPFTDYYYGVYSSGSRVWSDAAVVTGSVGLATENIIGGFYNVSDEATDYGYVQLDDTGHLRLLDYELLRSGTLAYQIAEDITLPSGIDILDTQTYLDEYLNRRIAFPPSPQLSAVPSVINVYMPLSESEEGGVIEINDIDSRFNTAICLHIQGNAGSNVTINIRDCQKFMIDPSIQGTPVINVYRTNIKYDAEVFQYIRVCPRSTSVYGSFTGFRDISLWYEQLSSEDPLLTVNGMTVSELDAQIIASEINYWKELGAEVNDNNYLVALKSITFSGEGDIVGCQILTANNSTDNIVAGNKIIVGDIVLPQGSSLTYPTACLTRKLKVTGEFTTAYYSDDNWYVTDTSFSLITGVFDPTSEETSIKGQVAFHSITTLVVSSISETSISVWEPDSYHVFEGGAIS